MTDLVAGAGTVSEPAESAAPRRRRQPILVHAVLLLGAVVMVFPFLWQVLTAFKSYADATAVPLQWMPTEWQFGNFAGVFEVMPLGRMFLNSVILTVVRTVGQVLLCTMAGYAFARIAFPGRTVLFVAFLSVLMVPAQLFLLPQYEIIQSFGWVNTLQGVIAPGMFSAFGTFLMRQFFSSLPGELEEAARLDGANQWQIFSRVMLPLAKPGIIALVVFTVLWSWNELLWPLIVTSDATRMPLSVGLTQLVGLHMTDYPLLMAGSLVATIPMILVFMVLQRQFIEGIAFTGGKG